MTVKCDILLSDEARNRILAANTVVFLFPVKSLIFGVNAPILFGGRSVLCLVSQSTVSLNGIGALSFKSTINEPGKCANTYPALTHTVGDSTMHAANDCTPHDPSGQDLPPELLNRIHTAAQDPTGRLVVALIRQLCPGLTPAVALEWIRADLAFEQDVLNEAAILLGGEWSQEN